MQPVGYLVLPCNTFRMLVYIYVPVFPLKNGFVKVEDIDH